MNYKIKRNLHTDFGTYEENKLEADRTYYGFKDVKLMKGYNCNAVRTCMVFM